MSFQSIWSMLREAAYARHRILVSMFISPGPIQDAENKRHDEFVDFMYAGVIPPKKVY